MNNLIDSLNWRYAVKQMNGNVIPTEKLDAILEAIQLSPSSMGLQPYTVLVIDNPGIKENIFNNAAMQPQIKQSSHLLVFAAWESVTAESIANYIQLIAETRSISIDSLAPFQNALGGILARSEEVNFDWSARQAYIALGIGMAAAAEQGIDATPMEGFNSDKLDEVLGLKAKGLKSVVLLALGYRDTEKDHLAEAKKVRRAKEELFVTI
tara:strand:+ start:675 stop:1304 length:630 start_codon:yes stop_codon:yes gene_type:complete